MRNVLLMISALIMSFALFACSSDKKKDNPAPTPVTIMPQPVAPIVEVPFDPPGDIVAGPVPPPTCSQQETIQKIGGGTDFSPSRIGSHCFNGLLNNGQKIPEPYYFCYCPDKAGTWTATEGDYGPCPSQPRGACHKGMKMSGHIKGAEGGCMIWECK